ncbi:MAG: carboxypeptidase regulatory-like domain-containing protein [Gemmatimonadota bacterium]
MRLCIPFLLAGLAAPVAAQSADTVRRAPASSVSGVVRDSIARQPLAGATVQIVTADSLARVARTVISDSLGRYTFSELPPGRYTLGFFHTMLDSLGLEPTLRQVHVPGDRSVHADLAIPSAERIRTTICGPRSALDSAAVLIGVVRSVRDGAPAAGATVTGEWTELTLNRARVVQRVPRLVATTAENGWFAMCDVPSSGTMALMAHRGGDSTDVVELQLPPGGFFRRELYLGSAGIVVPDVTERSDSLAPAPRAVRKGSGRLTGVVLASVDRRPLQGARVNIAGGAETTSNERGEFTLLDAPVGTRMLEVRAIGYYPERRRVDVIDGAPAVRLELSTLKAVLDTLRVTAVRNRQDNGFAQRRRSGIGVYLTPTDIGRHAPLEASRIFTTVRGVRLTEPPNSRFIMRGITSLWCAPTVYLDGHAIFDLSADELNVAVRVEEIVGIEIYAEPGGIPAGFAQGLMGGLDMNGTGASALQAGAAQSSRSRAPELEASGVGSRDPCGSILVWTR